MSEKDKMLAGEIYDANYDEELIAERTKVKDLCYAYNHLKPSNMDERKQVMRKIVGKIHGDFLIEQPFTCDYGYNIEIGENFYANHNLIILDANKVKFGDNVFIAPNCGFYTSGHPLDAQTRNQGLEYAYPIEIGNNVWIGGNTVVLPGVKIGDNCVIGAGSIVTKDIPSNSIAVGNPCKIIKTIRKYKNEDLDSIMEIWLDENIKAHEFIEKDYWKSKFEYVKQILPKSEIYVYEKKGIIRGFIGLDNEHIEGIFVKEKSKGIGKELIDIVKQNKNELSLHVYQKNIRAIDFYKKQGFHITEEFVDEATNEKEYFMKWVKER